VEQKARTKVVFLLVIFFGLAGATGPVWADSCDADKTFGREDKTLFARHCGVCHSLSGLWARVGPPLKGLFERERLVTGKPVTDENVREIILKGGPGLMPGFQYMLSADQVNEILRDIKENRCPNAPSGQAN
jgi:mono/diheme cytochrome c family protein